MAKLWASIKKDWRILIRDRVGLALMFIMPIVLAIVIASVQNSTFELVNNKKIPLLIANKDTGAASKELEAALEKGGMFVIKKIPAGDDALVKTGIEKKEALVGLVIPNNYTHEVMLKAENVSEQALQGVLATSTGIDTSAKENTATPLTLYYHPVLQNSFRQGIDEALSSVLQIVQSKYIVRQLYSGINDDATIPVNLEQQILTNQTPVRQLPVSKGSTAVVLNATQHNIPAWTVFAMFFIVISLGSSIVREKTSGSFLRLKTMPTSLAVSFVAKQITYVLITILQAIVIFGIGKWLFPKMGLPALN
ncbi:MAG TPA: ABC transporter permease, partial [Niabella sp.]|nr:ABC transporter permease [Niabella sp.]